MVMNATQEEIVMLLADRRFNQVDLVDVRPIGRDRLGSWAYSVTDEVYEVIYAYIKRVAPWDRQEVGQRRALVGRIAKEGPVGALAQFKDYEEGRPCIEVDPPRSVSDGEFDPILDVLP